MLEIYQGTGSPVEDLAFEAWMLDRAADGQPCFAHSSWPGPVVVLGYGQRPDDVDLDWCRGHGTPVLRRLTGGTGVVHRNDLGVALALPASHPWAQGVLGLYDRFLGALLPALRDAGATLERKRDAPRAARVRSPICFLDQLADTLLVEGRKAVGCAQTRRRGAALVHAAILLGLDSELYGRVFRVDPGRVRAALAPAVAGGDGQAIGRAVGREIACSLELEPVDLPSPVPPGRYLELYRDERWAPVIWP